MQGTGSTVKWGNGSLEIELSSEAPSILSEGFTVHDVEINVPIDPAKELGVFTFLSALIESHGL